MSVCIYLLWVYFFLSFFLSPLLYSLLLGTLFTLYFTPSSIFLDINQLYATAALPIPPSPPPGSITLFFLSSSVKPDVCGYTTWTLPTAHPNPPSIDTLQSAECNQGNPQPDYNSSRDDLAKTVSRAEVRALDPLIPSTARTHKYVTCNIT